MTEVARFVPSWITYKKGSLFGILEFSTTKPPTLLGTSSFSLSKGRSCGVVAWKFIDILTVLLSLCEQILLIVKRSA